MEAIPENILLNVPSSALYDIRKIHNLEKPERLAQAIDILESWIWKQDHIIKKDFSKEYLEKTLICCKGSVEKSKQQIDRLCTMKTMLPKFFSKTNVLTDLPELLKIGKLVPLPHLTDDYYRIIMIQLNSQELSKDNIRQYFQYSIIFVEYLKLHDYMNGVIVIYDFRQMNLFDLMTKIDVVELQQFITILLEGYGARLKSIHMLTESKAIELIINLIKQFVSQKIGNRIHVQPSLEDLHKAVPRELLPVEYGGKQKSIDAFHADVLCELSSEKHQQYVKMMFKACSDETKRNVGKFNEEYMGMPGSFRCLSVD